MEFNKEEFTRAILKFFTFPLDAFSSKEEYDEIKLSNRDEAWEISNYIPECIDFLYLNNELLVLKNSKLILEKNLEKLKKDIEKIDDTLIIETTNVKIKHVEDFINKIESSIETQETLDSPHLNEDKSSKRPLTEHQVVLFFHYVLKQLDVYSKVDKTKIAEIIIKITGKNLEPSKVKNDNVYKILRNDVLGYYKTINDSKTLQRNLDVVKKMLESISIDTTDINEDIKSYSE
jgi:hypothetical protein